MWFTHPAAGFHPINFCYINYKVLSLHCKCVSAAHVSTTLVLHVASYVANHPVHTATLYNCNGEL